MAPPSSDRPALQARSPNPRVPKKSAFDLSRDISQSLKRPAPVEDSLDDAENDHCNDSDDAVDDDDPRLDVGKWDCNQIRRMIRNIIENGEMNITRFCDAIGNSQKSYRSFMTMSGKEKGLGSSTYLNAHRFFMKRELQGIAPPRKKTKTSGTSVASASKTGTADAGKYDVSGVRLEAYVDREADKDVPIFETCDSVRRMINAHLRLPGETQAALARQFSAIMGKKIQGGQISSFLGKKGPRSGAESPAFYAGYVYFEKLRIKQGKKKSAFRQEMEGLWSVPPNGEMGIGVPRQDSSRIALLGGSGFSWGFDKYGIIETNGR